MEHAEEIGCTEDWPVQRGPWIVCMGGPSIFGM